MFCSAGLQSCCRTGTGRHDGRMTHTRLLTRSGHTFVNLEHITRIPHVPFLTVILCIKIMALISETGPSPPFLSHILSQKPRMAQNSKSNLTSMKFHQTHPWSSFLAHPLSTVPSSSLISDRLSGCSSSWVLKRSKWVTIWRDPFEGGNGGESRDCFLFDLRPFQRLSVLYFLLWSKTFLHQKLIQK